MARQRKKTRREGFTLVELMVVMVIIGIIITALLVVGADARRRAEEDATLALITKLDTALNDRLDALLQTRPDPNAAHYYLAGIYPSGATVPLPGAQTRAQIFAWYDFIKSELPDVFFVQNFSPGLTDYPLNFAFPTSGYPGTPIDVSGKDSFILPIGNSIADSPPASYGAGNVSNTMGTGIYGASYFAAAGVYKNLGYSPNGYDGVDNDGNGLIDEWGEGVNATALAHLHAHQHHTARAETLYAILVEGVGPLGSAFTADDFSDREVRDTDGDGLPEFVDAWGQPLQFFRWPLFYHNDSQKGQVVAYWSNYASPSPPPPPPIPSSVPILNPPYMSVFDAREQDPLDPNQQLMAPSWWSNGTGPPSSAGFNVSSPFATSLPSLPPGNAGSVNGSGGVLAFEYFFHRITEPLANPVGLQSQFYWDRGTYFPQRRAFYTKPLILSGGPDKQLGVYLYPDGTPGTSPVTATQLLLVENNAMPFYNDFTTSYTIAPLTAITPDDSYNTNALTSFGLQESGKDDITNQNRQASIGAGGP